MTEPMKTAPFYVGQKVIAVDALPGAFIKNGNIYIIVWCEQYCNKGQWFWGVKVDAMPDWMITPRLFAPLDTMKQMSFERMTETSPIGVN